MTDKKKLLNQLDALKSFPKNKLVRELEKQILQKLARLEKSVEQKNPRVARAGKLRRYHNYIRQIQNNFPELSYEQIREQLAKRKRGEEVSIPDAVWQNPSP